MSAGSPDNRSRLESNQQPLAPEAGKKEPSQARKRRPEKDLDTPATLGEHYDKQCSDTPSATILPQTVARPVSVFKEGLRGRLRGRGVEDLPPDLQEIVKAWWSLSKLQREFFVGIVRSTIKSRGRGSAC